MKVILGKKGLKTKSASEVSWRKDVCVCFFLGGRGVHMKFIDRH